MDKILDSDRLQPYNGDITLKRASCSRKNHSAREQTPKDSSNLAVRGEGCVPPHEHLVPCRLSLRNPRNSISSTPDECPFLVIPDSIVFDKVVQGIAYTKKVVLRNRENVRRRLRLEIDSKSPFRLSLPAYHRDGALTQEPYSRNQKSPNGCRVFGAIATGMCVQFLVSFSATSSAPDATGFIELHTEKGAFAIPIIARKEPPVLLSLPRVLHFGAVRPGESTCRDTVLKVDDLTHTWATSFDVTFFEEGGNAALRTFIVPAKPAPCCQHAEDPSPLLKASKAAEQADCISFLLNHGRRKDEDTFMVAEREVLLLQGRKDPSLSIRFSPREPGLFRATLLLILSERKVSAEARPEPLGVVELQGIADAAALTLKEFCGTQLPMELLTPLVDQQIPQGHTLLGGAGTQTPALACDNAAGIGLAAGAITRPAGALQEDELRQLQESYETALCLTAKETLFPQVVDFGYTLMMGVLKCALLSPLVYLKGLSAPSCPCLNAKEINMQRDTNDSMAAPPLRWMPLLATPKKICRQPNGTSCTQAVETSQAAEAEQREWEMLRFQMRLKIDRPRVVLLGPLPEGTAPYVARLRPGVVQSIALRARNEGRSKVRLAVRRDVRGLKARWRIPYACCGSSSSGKPPGEDPKTAWLLRVDEEQLEALQREQDLASVDPSPSLVPPLYIQLRVVGLGPQPFGYFCISPKGGTPLCPGAEEALILRVLPLCCGSFSASVAISVLPPASEDSAEPDEAELVEQARLSYPVSVEVAVPRVSASWPPVLDFGTVRAHSRTTRALLLYNPAPAPAIARIRILSSETTADAATAQGATLEMQSMAGEFPCHFGSCLLRGPSAGAFAPPATAVCEPSTEKGTESADPTCSVGEAAPLANPKVLPGKEEPETSRRSSSGLRCCSPCGNCACWCELETEGPALCNKTFMPNNTPRSLESVAVSQQADLFAAHPVCAVGGGEEVQQQQQNVLLHHLKAWKQQQTLQQGLRKPLAAVIGMSGRVIAYPGHVVLPPGGHGVFLLILRASHPQEIDSHIFVETLEGGQPVVVSIRAKVTLPKLRLSSHLLELPRLFLRQPMMLKKQLTVYNDSDIPTKIRWTSLAPMHHKEQEQDQLRHSACGEGPHSCQSDQGGLLVSLSPAESILRERSSVNVDICCVGLCAGTRLETKAFCKGDSLLVPLQVSLAGACSGVSVTYALFTQHQLVAAACLLQQRTRQNKSQERSSTHPDAAVEQHTHIKQEHKQTPFENRQQRKSDIECTSASEELDWGVEAVEVLQASGIGTWGALECGVSNSRGNSEGSQELALPKLHAGGDSAFVYLLAINNSPIPGALQVEAFTGQAPQQSLQKRQLHASAIRHPSLYEEGRPVGASMCPDCSGANAEWSCSNSRSLVLGTARRSSCSSTPTTNSLNSANSIEIGYASSLTAEALLIQAASFKAPSELKQLLPHTSAAQSLAFKTKSGVYTLQAAAGRQRRQQLLRMTEDGVLIIPHPETPCELQQHQAVLLAIEIFGAVPADYEGMLRLGLAPSEHLQLPLKDPQWAQEQCQVLIPVKIPVCGSLLLLPPLQKSIRYRECEPPLITAQISLQQPLIAAQLQKEQTALQRSGVVACYRKTALLLPLKGTKKNTEWLFATAATAEEQQQKQQNETRQKLRRQRHDEEVRVNFKVENNSNQWLQVNWSLFDLGLWEMQRMLQQRLQQAAAVRDAALEALRQRAVEAAREAAAAASVAAAAAAKAEAATVASHSSSPAPPRKPGMLQTSKAPSLSSALVAAAAEAAAAAEEAALKATEAATAAADAGIEEGSRGWEVLAGIVAEAMASTTSHMANEEHAPKEDQHQEIEPPLKPMEERPEQEAASAPRSAPKMAMEIETALRAEITAPEGATHQSAAAMPSKAKDAAISLNNRAEGVAPTPHAAPATKTQIDTELLPPQEYFVREWMPLSAEARGIAAASVVLRTHRASVPAGQTPHDAAVPKANVIKHADSPAAATYEQVEDEFAEPEPLRQGRTAAANDGLRVVTEGFVSGPEEESSSSRRSNLGSNSGNRRKKPEQFSEREGPSALGPIRGDRAETLLTEVIPPLSCAPRIEPCKAILAPFESLEVSLHCGLLLAATGVHRLRAIAHAVPLAAGKAFAAHDASPAAECPSGQTTPVGSSTQVTTHETESQRQQQQTMQHGFASRTESGKGQAVVGCTSSAVDKQKEKTFRNTTSAFPLVWPYSQQPLYTASDAKLHSVEQQRTGTMPGPHVATSATRTGAGPTPITALTATQRSDAEPLIVDFCIETKPPCFRLSSKGESHGEAAATEGTVTPPKGTARLGTVWFTASPVTNGSNGQKADVSEGLVLREVLLEPLPYCNSIRCGVSLEGKAFKLFQAKVQDRHQQEKFLPQQQQTLHHHPEDRLMFTIKKGQQLRLVVGFLPPTICELTRESKTNCTGKISIFLPGVSPLSSTQTNSPHGPFPVCPTLTEEQAAIEEPLCHTLLSGILRVLRPNEDPRPLLSLGLAALQQYHYQQAPPLEAAKALQQVQQQVLVQGLNTAWPTVPAAAAAAILEGGASSSQKAFGVSAALQASDQSAAAEAGPPEYTQTIALVGICRQSLILMWCPPDEGEKETHREEKRGSWAAHCVPSDPLVINFSTTHVQARKYPAKLLHLRAVSGTPSRWQVEECQSSEKPDAAPATMPVHMVSAFFYCSVSTHAGHHKSLFRISADLAAAPQYVELRGYATTDETFDVCASLGNLAEPPYQCIP
ncbi:uncharacterized protein LOC34623060 [Cyclospora cayetanensis]|uniref:Uncharacterized protein LOC34623060 n=1 Tax=Cyclospora cayetanensis TaxID=88456 RepID=A0A6P6RU25_9EIME|nr:uncharacterized protein LOC34623060 [Cyclospora cayetanensis]